MFFNQKFNVFGVKEVRCKTFERSFIKFFSVYNKDLDVNAAQCHVDLSQDQ